MAWTAVVRVNSWFRLRSRRRLRPGEREALAAKRGAALEHSEALARDGMVEEQARRIGAMNARNHFSESLTRAFGGRA